MKRVRNYKQILSWFLIGLLVIFFIGCQGNKPSVVPSGASETHFSGERTVPDPRCPFPRKGIFLVFNERNSMRIHAFKSNDGLVWNNGSFPENKLCILFGACNGVGGSGNSCGNNYMVSIKRGLNIQNVWGALGSTGFDNEVILALPLASAPTITNISDNRWAVAFRRRDDTVTVSIFDSNEGKFVVAGVEPLDPLNRKVFGRPAMVRKGNQILLAWARNERPGEPGSFNELIVSLGQIQKGILNFSKPIRIDLPSDKDFWPGLTIAPDVARDDDNFYIAIGRSTKSSGPLRGVGAVILSSQGGMKWDKHSLPKNSIGVAWNSKIQIAGLLNGTLVMVAKRPDIRGRPDPASVARYDPITRQWSSIDKREVFGNIIPSANYFTLVGFGKK